MAKADIVREVELILTDAVSNKYSYLTLLDTIAKFHKYDIRQQASLSFYASPNYIAVAEERIWKDFFKASVKADTSVGIGLLDDNAPDGIKIVYDASETDLPAERLGKLLWRFDSERDINVFRGISDEGTTPVDSVLQLCWQIEDSLAGKDLSGDDILLLSESVGYVVLKRLGFDQEADLLAEQTISEDVLTKSNLPLEDISDISREILNGIQDYVQRGKGRGEDFPLRDALDKVQKIIDRHSEQEQTNQQENSSVEAPVTEAADATLEAAEPEEAGVSPEAPAIDPATEAVASVAAEDVFPSQSPYVFKINKKLTYYLDNDGNYVHRDDGYRRCSVDITVRDSADAAFVVTISNSDFEAQIFANNIRDAFEKCRNAFPTFLPESDANALASSIVGNYQALLNNDFARLRITHPEDAATNNNNPLTSEELAVLGIFPESHENTSVEVPVMEAVSSVDAVDSSSVNVAPERYFTGTDRFTEAVANYAQQTSLTETAKADSQEEIKQENTSVEAPATEAADATQEAAGPEEAGVSPEAPAVDPATEAVASVAAENQVNRSQVDKRNFIISSKGRFIRRRSFGSAAISLSLMDDQSLEVRFLDDPNHSSFRVNSFDEAFSVSKERYSELSRPSPDPSLVAASVEGQYRDMLRLYKNRGFAESDISDPAISAVLSQEESPVEAPATEATDATQEAAEPEEAGASTEAPAVDPVTEAVASVAADDSPFNIPVIVDRRRFDMSPDGLELVEFSSTPDPNTWGTQSRELPENYITVGMEYMSNGRIDVKIFDSVTEDEKVFSASSHDELMDSGRKAFSEMLPDADDADLTMLSSRLLTHSILMERPYDAAHREIHASAHNEEKEYAEFMESYAKEQQDNVSSEASAVDSATDSSSVAAEYDSSLDDDYSRDVVDSRTYFISSDGKRSNKPKPSMLRIGVDLRDDGAAYIDIATHNRNTGAGILADDPNDAHEFALRTPLTQNFNPQVIADAILSDYQEMMQQHNILVPSVVDQRRFDVSPDGVDVMEYAYDPENDRWTSSGPSPDNHIRFDMRYMSNGRVDVGISDSVTGQTRIFKDYENLYNSARAIIADVVPDSNAAMLANWVVQHAVLMERTAKKDSQHENTSVEAAAPEAVDATQKAAGPEEAVSSAEAPAVDPATDDSSVAVDDFDNSISVEEYFKLAGVQVIPANRSLEFMAYAKEHFANESTDFGKFVIINDPDMVTGETSFTVPGNGSDSVTYHEKPDYVLHILGVDMEAFRDALAKYDGTNLDEVALPSNNLSNLFIEVFSDDSIQQESTSVEIPATEAVDATQEAAGPEEAGVSPETPAVDPATDNSSVAAEKNISVSDYLRLAGIQVIPDDHKDELLALAHEKASDDNINFGKYAVINGINVNYGSLSITIVNDNGITANVFPDNHPDKLDHVLNLLDVDMEAFRDALAKYDGTNLDEVALPIEHSSFKISTPDDNLIYSPFLSVGPSSDYPKEKQVQQESSNTDSVSTAETSPIIESEIKFHGGKKGEAFQRNIKAIRTLKTLEKENRSFNDKTEEYALLDYSGFGNLSEVFDENNESWKPERDLLKSLLTNEEYISARSSVLSAYYTNSSIVSSIYVGLSDMGFKSGNILEPSCGIGNFFYDMPGNINRAESHLCGVELDPISGRIAKHLHPDANISIQGFESTSFPNGSFDLSITNVPFENYKIQGLSVHDFFISKMMEQTRPGGLVVAITSRYTMDKKDSSVREDLAQRAELVKAIRLPNNAFSDAGAEATTDILIFRRREKNLDYGDPLPSWVNSVPFEGESSINVNSYFIQHPEDVIGSLEKKSTAYGFDLTCKPTEKYQNISDIASGIQEAMSTIRTEYIPLNKPLPVPEQTESDNSAVYSFFTKGDELLFRGTNKYDIQSLSDLGIDQKDIPQVMQLIRVRDLTREVIRSQRFTDNDDALHTAQERLSSVYQDYVKTYGDLHSKKVKQLFECDCSYPLLLSLENTDSKGKVTSLSDIFTKRTIRPHIPPTHVDSAHEALIVSMTELGKVDLDYMARLTGMDKETMIGELEFNELFYDSSSRSYLSADEYLSGDVREKMELLEQQKQFFTDRRDREIWDSLTDPIGIEPIEYQPKNDTEEKIFSNRTSYRYTDEAKEYFQSKTGDWEFYLGFLEKFPSGVYLLPESVSDNPLFALEAGLRQGTSVTQLNSAEYITGILCSMNLDGLDNSKYSWERVSNAFDYLENDSQGSYWQKRACVHYLRALFKDYDGDNGPELLERAKVEWPKVWQELQEKFNATLEKNELPGIEKTHSELERIEKNLAALQAVCPKDLEAEDISVRLGAPWIPPEDIVQFMDDVFGTHVSVEYSDVHHGQWKLNIHRGGLSEYSEKAKEFSTDELDAGALLEKILNLQAAVVKDRVIINGKETDVINQEKTVLAQQKQEMIKEAFAKWIWQDVERKNRIVKYYNRHFNNIRPREFDGSHLEFPGMNPEIQLRDHQKDAIAHTLFGGNTLLAHCVGAGKSFEMIASIMESKRLGLSNKAMLVVPGHLTEQMGAEFMRLYPTANILVATKKDFEKAHRKEFCAKIATHNWDAVILGFTQFEKIAMSKEYMEQFTKDEINRLSTEIAIAKEKEDGKSLNVRQMERLRKSLEGKLDAIKNRKPKDDVLDFEDLGIDRLYVDEAHNFKNLALVTKLGRIPGVNTTGAQKSTDFYQKVQYLNNKTNGKGLVFATGTAVSNSMTELYIMQQYLQPERLNSEGLRHFDSWAATFGDIATVQELAPEGKGIRPRQRFSKFCNLPELMSLVKEFADIKTEDMLDLPTPNVEYHVESVPASAEQKAIVDSLAERATAIRNKSVDTSLPQNNMLSVTNEGRKLALDQRLINPDLPDYPDSKVNRCVSNIFRIWEETTKQKGTQLVFSDFSTPDKAKFNVYDDIKEKLIAKGVPADEIAYIHDATDEKQKEELFSKVRSGKVRVLIGSTGKLGTGTNVQDKLVASHDLDVPWKPSDLEQRKGRIARQGNENEKVDVYRYVTEGTFDSYMWQILENKQRFISQILTSKTPARVTEDADELVLSCAEIKAIATGSPLIRERMELDVEVERLKIARKGYLAEQASRQKLIDVTGPQHIIALEKYKAAALSDVETLKSYVPPKDGTLIVIGGKSFKDEREAGEAIVTAIRSGHGEELTGSYKGMKFKLSPGYNWQLELVGKMSYSEDVHWGSFAENMKRLAKIEERILNYPDKVEADIQKTQKKIEEARELSTRPFAREEEYQQKVLRLQELTVLLNEEISTDKEVLKQESERRLEYLASLPEDASDLEKHYAHSVLNNTIFDEPWTQEKDQELARDFLKRGFTSKDIQEVLLKNSPNIYDATTVEHIVSQAPLSNNEPTINCSR